ncbi:tRNA glutamyl-Q(34) synthetase GluQRS [Parasphingopyxis lamellibrachiae]|uniref:Glutamyl-Q tRNA(Asp) synthetase n=1 Tax=Parasphingopyxis lamellibrachiae TaxID=680125 RepID=A0A3D9FI04_9SPHN|nr:tRNA glutamyl-Q(34) synthetase GluQRS [Parasphingopyxis lamellibrachiae]RED17202.1 glutamyl-Q tRNA(Asp) synthetase [Parasphingopyxis lamellibrachiae]
MSDALTTRFAPSPTGLLHLGHGYSALRAFDLAHRTAGRFLLRFEDIDAGRIREEYYAAIETDLHWLGITWAETPLRQSSRFPAYRAVLDRLKDRELVYPCFCTRKDIAAEIAASASAPHGPDGALYPGSCRTMAGAERARRVITEPHAWRIDMARAAALAGRLFWTDAKVGRVEARPEIHGDVVLARKDVPTSYHLAVTVDDAEQGVTDIVRGEDLFAATHVHRLLQHLLELPVPRYHHHALIADEHGKRLAKRDDARSLASLQKRGIGPAVVRDALRRNPPDIARLIDTGE